MIGRRARQGELLAAGFPLLAGILYPAGGVVFIVIVLRSMWVTLRNRGIRWRDTFYPLEELRAGKA